MILFTYIICIPSIGYIKLKNMYICYINDQAHELSRYYPKQRYKEVFQIGFNFYAKRKVPVTTIV